MTKANKILITIGIIGLILTTIQIWRAKGNSIAQAIRGDKNVQIQGDGNYVDNRTYVFNMGIDSKLLYSVSKIEKSKDGRYQRKLTIQAKGNIPVYNPKIYLRFDKPVQNADFEFLGGVVSLFNLRTNSDLSTKTLNNIEYFFATKEFTPGSGLQFIFSNDTKFNISEFKINGQKLF